MMAVAVPRRRNKKRSRSRLILHIALLGWGCAPSCAATRAARPAADRDFDGRVALYRDVTGSLPRCARKPKPKTEHIFALARRTLSEGEPVAVIGTLVPLARGCTEIDCDRRCCNGCSGAGWAIADENLSGEETEQARLISREGGSFVNFLDPGASALGSEDCDPEAARLAPARALVTGRLVNLPKPEARRVTLPLREGEILHREGVLHRYRGLTIMVDEMCRPEAPSAF
jgi:hypothetical protein